MDLHRALKPGCVNWALRSRISNLNERFLGKREPWLIESRRAKNGCNEYRLVKLVEFDENGQSWMVGRAA